MVIRTIGKTGSGAEFTCDDGTSNQNKIKEALDSLLPGDTLKAYPGIYVCDLPIGLITKTGRVTLTSVDPNNQAEFKIKSGIPIPIPDGGPWYYARLFNLGNFNISNIIINGNYDAYTGGDGYFGGIYVDNCLIENCTIKNIIHDGIKFQSNCIVRNNYIYRVRHDGIVGNGASNNNLIENNYIEIFNQGNAGIRTYSGYNNIYKANIIKAIEIGIYFCGFEIHNVSNIPSMNNIYENNVIINATGYAGFAFMEIAGGLAKTSAENQSGQIIRNNLFINCPKGVSFCSKQQLANMNEIKIENNTFVVNSIGIHEYTQDCNGAKCLDNPCRLPIPPDTNSREYGGLPSSILSGNVYIDNNIIVSPTGIKSETNGRPDLFKLTKNCITGNLGSGVFQGTELIQSNPLLDSTYRVPVGNPAYGLGANIDLLPPPYGMGGGTCTPQGYFKIIQ